MLKNISPKAQELKASLSIIEAIKAGKLVIMPTDTIYGLVGSALIPDTVEEIYKLRKRAKDKPMIILISSLNNLRQFDIKLSNIQKRFLEKNWPNPLSVILSCKSKQFKYLHRGKKSLAFRMPKDEKLLALLKQTGPLVAPSANFEGDSPAENINQAKKYFGNAGSFYVDGGVVKSQSSTIISLDDKGKPLILRQGKFKIAQD